MKGKTDKIDLLKLKFSALPKTLVRELKDKLLTKRRYFQNTYPIKDWYEMIHGG